MSIKYDNGLIDKYRELEDSMSMSIKIRHDQVCEIVVADLMSKYKAQRNGEYKAAFDKVLHFYLTDDEFNELLDISQI